MTTGYGGLLAAESVFRQRRGRQPEDLCRHLLELYGKCLKAVGESNRPAALDFSNELRAEFLRVLW